MEIWLRRKHHVTSLTGSDKIRVTFQYKVWLPSFPPASLAGSLNVLRTFPLISTNFRTRDNSCQVTSNLIGLSLPFYSTHCFAQFKLPPYFFFSRWCKVYHHIIIITSTIIIATFPPYSNYIFNLFQNELSHFVLRPIHLLPEAHRKHNNGLSVHQRVTEERKDKHTNTCL